MHTTTIWQPWASLIAIGAKPFETRAYPPPAKLIGQRIAIHAAVKDPYKVTRDLPDEDALAIVRALLGGGVEPNNLWNNLPRGAVVATAVLAGAYRCGEPTSVAGVIRTTEAIFHSKADRPCTVLQTDPFGDYSPGRWAWLLTDVQRLPEPVPAKGKQGWWIWEPPCPSCGGSGKVYSLPETGICAACDGSGKRQEAAHG